MDPQRLRALSGLSSGGGRGGRVNGKFMQPVRAARRLCATPASHYRRTYRNFFPADARWQFSGCGRDA
jgi:hypothetical protein